MRLHRRSRPLLIRPLLAVCLLCLLSACATTESSRSSVGEDAPLSSSTASESTDSDVPGCRPFFISPLRDEPEEVPRHSCWHRLWEVPAALVIAPAAVVVAVGVVTAPIWVPILLIP